ncbi:545_t:CDS:2 [Cetraspora pellucida]|uniref:545_t:CDS:1 n=1 Tax=Cetraspora pellucida TaxID=1433469 RepID=A0A9N9CJA2_9GLOM|nr:545_t:CDS:2 [Cetraspora pellucida]
MYNSDINTDTRQLLSRRYIGSSEETTASIFEDILDFFRQFLTM